MAEPTINTTTSVPSVNGKSVPKLNFALFSFLAMMIRPISVALATILAITAPVALTAQAALPAAVAGQQVPSLAPMLAKVTPAVVSVQATSRVRVSPFGNDPVFSQMFPGLTQERQAQSLGSGVIVDAERGLVITNHHVIEGADNVSVQLSDGRTLKAEFVGSDPATDIAVMRIPTGKLTALPLGDSASLRVGDFVVAVGNPFGIGQTVTSGIVSAVGRQVMPGAGYQNFIQTDASINPGNSGGALVDLNGRLVGINTATFNPRGSAAGNIGLSFAIPTDLVKTVSRQLLTTGSVQRGSLGVDASNVTPALAQQLGVTAGEGVAVTRVLPGSDAVRAGVKVGDVILSANGTALNGRDALHNFEGLQQVGSDIRLVVLRDGKRVNLSTRLNAEAASLDGASVDPRLAGATFGPTPHEAVRAGVVGVLVTDVRAGSRAAQNGLVKGDLIIATNQGPFDSLTSFRAAISRPSAPLVFEVIRGQRRGQVQMR